MSAKNGPYYLGIDAGVASVGWAVTDFDYNILKRKGQDMWGARMFDEATTSAARRGYRTARRRLERRKQRLDILEMLFAPALNEKDPQFLIRMRESAMWIDDKSTSSRYSLFSDEGFTDAEYHRKYPTAYHLRSELAHSNVPHDVRLVYLALHHLMKSRGHFLYDISDLSGHKISAKKGLEDFCEFLKNDYDLDFIPDDFDGYLNTLQDSQLRITQKAEILNRDCARPGKNAEGLSAFYLSELLAGRTVKISSVFGDDTLKASDKSVSLRENLDEKYDELYQMLDDRVQVLLRAKEVYDAARLAQIIRRSDGSNDGEWYICDAKKEIYRQNKLDLRTLKDYVRSEYPAQYKHIFSEPGDAKGKVHNYSAYSRYHHESGDCVCTQEDFCKYLRKTLPEMKNANDPEVVRIYQKIEDGTFLPRLRSGENGIIPYQMQLWELQAILKNAVEYLPFLSQKDTDGNTPAEKVIRTFEFRVPYYVGPLGKNAVHRWAVMRETQNTDKISPWNFEQRVDLDNSAEAFMVNLIGRCTYTGEPVLPKDSLLYSEYMLLNELNPLRINGKPLPVGVKKAIIDEMFLLSQKKGSVTKKRIFNYLLAKGEISRTDVISGIDDNIKCDLRSHRDFADILYRTGDTDLVEKIIKAILVFGDDKKMLRRWLNINAKVLTEDEKQKVCRLKYEGWGSLSEEFLTGIYSKSDQYDTVKNIMDMLRDTSDNLMQLLSRYPDFLTQAEARRDEHFGNCQTLEEKLDDMYLSPAVRRSIRQTLRVTDEIVKLCGAPPAKIFIEMARGGSGDSKGTRTKSRKKSLLELYKTCENDAAVLSALKLDKTKFRELEQRLENEEEANLRSIRLYLYYTQLGRCMYSGEPMDLSDILNGTRYDRDHIFPRSKIKDDSLDNLVLVKNELNRDKTNKYPIDYSVRKKMLPFWKLLRERRMISEKKYERLIRDTPFTKEEMSDFVARQMVQTRQSTKALTILLKERYGDKTKIVFSKAGNISEFRQEFKIIKCRELNDLHHAKDAYLNIVVGNVYDTRFTKAFFRNIENEEYSVKTETLFKKLDTENAWNKNSSIKTVRKYVNKNTPIVTRMPFEKSGQLFDTQLLPAGKGQLEKKRGMDIQKYGGYNKRSVSYYFAVEFSNNKKRMRAIQPVYLHERTAYENDPVAYCVNILKLSDPVIIQKRILVDAMLELDGKRLYLSSRTGNNLIYEHSYQLVASDQQTQYIKDTVKYAALCEKTKNQMLPSSKHDGISLEQNLALYDWFIEKCSRPVYAEFVSSMKTHLQNNRERFKNMKPYEQSKILLEVLKAFQCSAQNPNLEALCGVKTVARISKSCSLNNFKSAYLVNRSVTGLYENKIDLLK